MQKMYLVVILRMSYLLHMILTDIVQIARIWKALITEK